MSKVVKLRITYKLYLRLLDLSNKIFFKTCISTDIFR